MKHLLIIIALMSAHLIADEEPVMMHGEPEISQRTHRIANDFEVDLASGKLKQKTHKATAAIIRLAAYKLKRVGKKAEANQLLKEWKAQEVYFLGRGIGDHKALSKWLSDKYDMLEFTLGKEICYSLRLSDLKTINYGIPVVLSCVDNVDLEEYGNHFIYDDEYRLRGLGPVAGYWTSFFACVGGTWGSGFLFCAPIASGVEYLAKNYVCPKLNEPLWNRACKN